MLRLPRFEPFMTMTLQAILSLNGREVHLGLIRGSSSPLSAWANAMVRGPHSRHVYSQLNGLKRMLRARVAVADGAAMDMQAQEWKHEVERLWSAHALDDREAVRLVTEIARSEEPALQQAAAQALPSLRHACLKSADRMTKALARRRLGAVRDALHALTAPRFGKRRSAGHVPTPEEHHRHLLGLPLGRRLFGPEIHQAYKRTAKTVHPDGGGSERAFLELSAARDALMKAL
jgi:hypothetical protein